MQAQPIDVGQIVRLASRRQSERPPLRIAQIVNTLEIGGLERLVVDLVLALRRRGHVLHVLCLRQSGALSEVL